MEVDMTAYCEIVKRLHDVLDEVDHICFQEMQPHLTVVYLPHVKQLVDKPEDSQAVTVHQIIEVFLLRILLTLSHFLQRTHDKGQRCTDFMGNVREHLKLHFLELGFLLFDLEIPSSPLIFQRSQYGKDTDSYVYDPCPDAQIPWSQNSNTDLPI